MDKIIVGIAIAALAASAQGETVNFDKECAGTLPADWVSGVTGRGTPRWTVETDPGAPSAPNVTSSPDQATFPFA